MVGTTLADLRDHIKALASDDGEYYVVCGRTGELPVPAVGKRFKGRATARSAALATERYRTALRRYDPQVPYYDLIVCQQTERPVSPIRPQESDQTTEIRAHSRSVLDGESQKPERRHLVEFCHSIAAAVFETLSDGGYDGVETAVMDAYFDLAETIPDPDDLCLCLLESMAMELDERLTPAEQATVIAGAATRLPPAETTDRPVSTTLSRLEERGLLGEYTQSPWSIELDNGTRSIVVRLSEYALAPREDRLPVLPIVIEAFRHHPDWLPSSLRVVSVDDGWLVTLVMAREVEPSGLASAPIVSET